MGRVFLSYDHDDRARVAPIAAAIEKAGHSVWWDERIAAGAEYNSEIEAAVERADAVVVLWSERSVRSAWVRDEAAEGRDRGKLVPITIDGTKPPMGFRQYQTIDLSKRKRTGGLQNMDNLLRVIGDMGQVGASRDAPTSSGHAHVPQSQVRSFRWPVLAAFVVALLVSATFVIWRAFQDPPPPIITVIAADQSARAGDMAQNLLVKLGSLQSAKTNVLRLIGANKGGETRTDFILETSGSGSPRLTKANLALLAGKDRTLLWSKDFRQEAESQGDLEQQMAYTAGYVMDCAVEGSEAGQERINQDTFKLFLNGCALFAEKYRTDPQSVVPIFLRVIESSPRFQPAWRKLLLAESLFTRTERLLNRFTPGALPEHIGAARKLNPGIPEIYLAESTLVPINAFTHRSGLLDRAIQLDSDNPDLLLMRAEFYAGVGRMAESVDDANRAVELNPLSPGLRSHLIADLAYAGQIERARQELQRAEQLWPDSAAIDDARFRLNNRYGNPKLAMQMFKSGKMKFQPMVSPMIETFLLARMNPVEVNVQRAMAEVKKRVSSDPRALGDLIQAAGEFHREEDLYRMLLNWRDTDTLRILGEVLFRPTLAAFRRDPRFIPLVDRAALVDYWRSSGRWPDFCFEPDFPYDCKEEAAKLGA